MATKSVETDATTVTYSDGLLVIRSKGVHSTQTSVDATLAAAAEMVGDTRGPMLFDAREWPGGDPAGWISVIKKIGHIFTAAAMLVDPEKIDEIGSFPKAIDRLVIPFQAFDNEPSALAFLEPFRPETDRSS